MTMPSNDGQTSAEIIKDHRTVRVDKGLWAVRLYKTRAAANEACKRGFVSIDGQRTKASRSVAVGQTVTVTDPELLERYGTERVYQATRFIASRVAAKLVPEYIENQSLPAPSRPLSLENFARFTVERGDGRPRKKERRKYNEVRQQSENLPED